MLVIPFSGFTVFELVFDICYSQQILLWQGIKWFRCVVTKKKLCGIFEYVGYIRMSYRLIASLSVLPYNTRRLMVVL